MTRDEALMRIIWSADVPDWQAMLYYLDAMPDLRWIKVDRAGIYRFDMGLKPFDILADRGLKTFGDGKFIEVPRKGDDMAGSWSEHPVHMMNCMGGMLSTGLLPEETDKPDKVDGLYRFADLCNKKGILSCGVTVLTSKSPEMVAAEYNGRNPTEQVLFYVEWMAKFGFTDIVCSPKEIKAILCNPEFADLSLNTPGVRSPGAETQDQSRVDTPANAIANGARRIVVGSEITGKPDPAAALEAIVEQLMVAELPAA